MLRYSVLGAGLRIVLLLLLVLVLLVGGLLWCREMYHRFSSDLARLKESDDSAEKGVILFLWVVTGGIILLVGSFTWGLARGILSAF